MSVDRVFSSAPARRHCRAAAEPLDVYERLFAAQSNSFLYESLEENQTRGRYSFLGGRPRLVFQSKGDRITLRYGDRNIEHRGNPLGFLRELLRATPEIPPVLPFPGGAVGYLGYDMVRFFENVPDTNPDDPDLPDSYFIFPEEIVVFDHAAGTVDLIVYSDQDATLHLNRLEDAVKACTCQAALGSARRLEGLPIQTNVPMVSRTTEPEFTSMVNRARQYIHAGDAFQIVLSRRFDFSLTTSPMAVYRALRHTNPSPYMYFLDFGDTTVLGSSPEVLVKLQGDRVTTRPLAGTRPRGTTHDQDVQNEHELRADEKERAEHVMLVDLARNDLGRVCSFGTVQTTELLQVERFSQVMHLVSHVEGRLADGFDAFDVLAATFPAGTVSGAPKVRAMAIIDELENHRRGIYAGAIGYFSLRGDLDMCIAIRTIVLHGGRGLIQAGAGIVADSVAWREFEETAAKAGGVMRAVRVARGAA